MDNDYFFNVIRDQIGSTAGPTLDEPRTFENEKGSNVQGIEFELRADLDRFWNNAYAYINYTYLDAESKGDPLAKVPKHKGNIGVNASITKSLNANLHMFVSDYRVRKENDPRDDSPGYALVNLTLKAKELFNNLTIKASLFNLFDKDYDDPSSITHIPTDKPRPGRTFTIEMSYKF